MNAARRVVDLRSIQPCDPIEPLLGKSLRGPSLQGLWAGDATELAHFANVAARRPALPHRGPASGAMAHLRFALERSRTQAPDPAVCPSCVRSARVLVGPPSETILAPGRMSRAALSMCSLVRLCLPPAFVRALCCFCLTPAHKARSRTESRPVQLRKGDSWIAERLYRHFQNICLGRPAMFHVWPFILVGTVAPLSAGKARAKEGLLHAQSGILQTCCPVKEDRLEATIFRISLSFFSLLRSRLRPAGAVSSPADTCSSVRVQGAIDICESFPPSSCFLFNSTCLSSLARSWSLAPLAVIPTIPSVCESCDQTSSRFDLLRPAAWCPSLCCCHSLFCQQRVWRPFFNLCSCLLLSPAQLFWLPPSAKSGKPSDNIMPPGASDPAAGTMDRYLTVSLVN